MQHMFDAAERGDDFTLPTVKRTPNKIRLYLSRSDSMDSQQHLASHLLLSSSFTRNENEPRHSHRKLAWDSELPASSDDLKFVGPSSSSNSSALNRKPSLQWTSDSIPEARRVEMSELPSRWAPKILAGPIRSPSPSRWELRTGFQSQNEADLQRIHREHSVKNRQTRKDLTSSDDLSRTADLQRTHRQHAVKHPQIRQVLTGNIRDADSFRVLRKRAVNNHQTREDLTSSGNFIGEADDLVQQARNLMQEAHTRTQKADGKVNSTKRKHVSGTAEQIVAATQQQHKAANDTVCGRNAASTRASQLSSTNALHPGLESHRSQKQPTFSPVASSIEQEGPPNKEMGNDRFSQRLQPRYEEISKSDLIKPTAVEQSPVAPTTSELFTWNMQQPLPSHLEAYQVQTPVKDDTIVQRGEFTESGVLKTKPGVAPKQVVSVRNIVVLPVIRTKVSVNPGWAALKWREYLDARTNLTSSSEYQELLAAWQEFHDSFDVERAHPALMSLARHLFNEDPNSNTAAQIIFDSTLKSPNFAAEKVGAGHRYLKFVIQHATSSLEILREFDNVIRALNRLKIPLDEGVFLPLLTYLVSVKELTKVKLIFDDMVHIHKIQPSLSTLPHLLSVLAATGDWVGVRNALEHLHFQETSRQKPISFSLTFSKIFRIFAAQNPVEQTYDFLAHGVAYLGLIPVPSISATLVEACIYNRRYDLLQEWAETVRTMFPQTNMMTDDLKLCITNAWQRGPATCEDVEHTCKALTQIRLLYPFGPWFEALCHESLNENLTLLAHDTGLIANVGDVTSVNLDTTLKNLQTLWKDRPESIPSILKPQINAARRAVELLTIEDVRDHPLIRADALPPRLAHTESPYKAQQDIPGQLKESVLPHLPRIKELVSDYYRDRETRGLPLDGFLLNHVSVSLQEASRWQDLTSLMLHAYHEHSVSVLNLDLVSSWLRCGGHQKTFAHIRAALWAAVDLAEAGTRITHRFCLLVKRTRSGLENANLRGYDKLSEEVFYLWTRLLRYRREQEQQFARLPVTQASLFTQQRVERNQPNPGYTKDSSRDWLLENVAGKTSHRDVGIKGNDTSHVTVPPRHLRPSTDTAQHWLRVNPVQWAPPVSIAAA